MRIIIADDNEAVRVMVRAMLGLRMDTFTSILEASNGKEALELCQENRIDLVLMDLSMPVMDGFEATKLITEQSSFTKVIAFSAFLSPKRIDQIIEAGAVGYLRKGSGPYEVLDKINEVYSNPGGNVTVHKNRTKTSMASSQVVVDIN